MITKFRRLGLGVIGLGLFLSSTVNAEQIAGVNPSQRPAGAPTITNDAHDDSWHKEATHGLTKPYSPSLKFLNDQGNWYTPFNRPGMLSPYDVRGWH